MAYLDSRSTRPSPAAVTAVIGIHAAMGYALVTGLATDFVEEIYTGPLPATDYTEPEVVPPPPPDEKTVEPTDTVIPPTHAPIPPVDLVRDPVKLETTSALLPPIDDIILDPLPPSTYVTPKPTPSPGLDPVAARPRNNPANWVTTNDYPSRAIREEWEGTTSFKVTVGTDGRAQDCTITRSSGHAALDEATCAKVMKRARFKAAMDGFGEKTAGSYSGSVLWQLPD